MSNLNRAANWGAGYTATVYDVLGRPKTVAAPNGETTEYKYVGRSTRVLGKGYGGESGTNRVLKWTETNALGFLYRVRTYNKPFEENGTTQAEITLAHDVMGNLTGVSHPNSLGSSAMTYDVGGRKLTMSDISLGNWSYGYDRQGRLTSQTDACGNITSLSYNTLNQLTGKSFTDTASCGTPGVPYSVSYTYGSSGTATGQLTEVKHSDNSYIKTINYYSTHGNVQSETVKIVGGATAGYSTSYGYDSFLRPTTTTYPDNEMLTVSYNSMGLTAKLTSTVSGVSTLLVNGITDVGPENDAVTYDEAGRLTAMRFPAGGNLWRAQSYRPWTATHSTYPGNGNGRLATIKVSTPNGSNNDSGLGDRMNRIYDYDSFGNIKRETAEGAATTFTYNHQNQLLSAYSQVYNYDNLGRLSNYEGTSPALNANFPAYMPKYSGYNYDVNGNVTARNGRTLVWNVQNQLKEVKNGTTVEESYLYNPDGQRIKKTVGSTSTYYPFAHYEISPSTIIKYYYFNGRRIAQRNGSTLYYLHGDQLGSTVVTTSGANATRQYYAYGRLRGYSGSFPSRYQFTGQYIDDSGLYYYNARYYDPTIGTFISPDTVVPDAGNLFDYNRYMMVRGNPLKYNDPSGHCATLDGGAPDLEGDGGCWDAANEWFATFGKRGFDNANDWHKYFASSPSITEDILRTTLHSYWAPQYQAMGVYHQRYNPSPQMHPVTSQDQAFEQFVQDVKCENPVSCVTNTLDGVSVGGAGVAAICTVVTGGACVVIAGPAAAISTIAGGAGVAWTAYQVAQGNGTETDLATATSTFTIGAARSIGGETAKKVNPWIGLAAGLYQWYYDNNPPPYSSPASQQ